MQMQSVCGALSAPKLKLLDQRTSSRQFGFGCNTALKDHKVVGNALSSGLQLRLRWSIEESFWYRLKRGTTRCSSNSNVKPNLPVSRGNSTTGVPNDRSKGLDPFPGKSGSVSFYGLTHQSVEEGKLESSPFADDQGSSHLWFFAPVVIISSLILPQFFLGNAIEGFFKNETLVEMVSSLSFEAVFYIGLAIFLVITDRVQRPYLQFSPKRWSLITGLRGYLSSAFLTMGLKVFIPLFMVYISWPVVGVPAIVAVAPFLVGCLAQLLFEKSLEKKESSCWPLVPIIFEVYRLYQLTKAAHYIERLMFAMRNLPSSPELLDRSGALVAMIVSFQALGLLCLWSLITFLLRLFPSRPVSENY